MNEVTNVLISLNLFMIIRNINTFWFVLINPFSPNLFISLNSIWEFFEEESMLISKLMLWQSFKIKPSFLVHPVEWLVSIIDTSTWLKEYINVSVGKLAFFNQDLKAHHKFECDLISFEKSSIDISIHLHSKPFSNIVDSIFDKLSLWWIINWPIEKSQELLKWSVIHPVD